MNTPLRPHHPRGLSETNRYTLYGALFGLCFPIGSIAFRYAMGALRHATSLVGIVVAAHRDPLLYVIDTAPLFLGLFARFAGIRQDRLLRIAESLEQQVDQKTESLRLALAEATRANETIAHMAEHDALTGLLNRRRFQKELDRWTQLGARAQRPAAVLFIDLDRFKGVNDAFGHAAGDYYLSEVGKMLLACVRSTDFVARWGGDEFAALLPETGREGAVRVATKLNEASAATPIQVEGQILTPSLSVGISLFPDHGADFNELIVLADAAMYQAKQRTHGSWQLYSASAEEMERVHEHARWEQRIRRALDNDQFLLYYQPLLDLRSGKTWGYEALLRMEDADGGLISPGLFLESAERFGLAIPIDRMVVRKAARKIESFAVRPPRISLNLSRQSLQDTSLADYLMEALKDKELPPDFLGIEIAESIVLQHLPATIELIARMRDLGILFILDDFSMGGALRYLNTMPVSMVKLDGSLSRGLNGSSSNEALIASLVALAHDAGIEVAAKYIEDTGTLSALQRLNVDYVQGFAVGRPMESIEQAREMRAETEPQVSS
ncbi:MAG: putative bifunctional diguanylate cyclase/phosphodiesterase [Acidiferrobacteraceae bacterium]